MPPYLVSSSRIAASDAVKENTSFFNCDNLPHFEPHIRSFEQNISCTKSPRQKPICVFPGFSKILGEHTSLNLSEERRSLRSVHAFPLQVEEKVLVALESCTTSKTILLYPLCFHISSLGQRCVLSREMENISRGRTFGDFVTIRTERSMQDVSVARLQSTRVQKTPISPLF
jgi:hypothetical protein